jgi:transposase
MFERAMIPIRSGVRVWIKTSHTAMRRGMQSLALTVQESLKPHAGDLCIFRGRRCAHARILWYAGVAPGVIRRGARAQRNAT